MHPNAAFQKCLQPEAMDKIPEGKLDKTIANDVDDDQLQRRAVRLAQIKYRAEQV